MKLALAAGLVTGGLTLTTVAQAQGLLPSSPPAPVPEVELDPSLPTGPPRTVSARPASQEAPACSPRRPVCVHRGRAPAATALRTLEAFEVAYEKLVFAVGLPAPLGDDGRGGGDQLDLYLDSGAPHSFEVLADAERLGPFDQAPGFCVLGFEEHPELERAATTCVAEASALGLDAGMTPFVRRAFATHLWLATGWPTGLDYEAIDDFQSRPDLATLTRDRDRRAEGAAMWFDYLEHRLGRGSPGELATFLLSLAVNETPPEAATWNNEPDVFDVLRRSLATQNVGDVLGGFALGRAFVGERDDGMHLPTLGWAGTFGNVRFDWHVKFSSLPRNLAMPRPIEPTGSSYVWLELDDVPAGASLAFRASWEPPVAFKWRATLIGPDGAALREIDVVYEERATRAERQIVDLSGARAVLIVGTNIGGVTLAHPFDPDVAPFEPHGHTLYLARL